MKPNSCKVFENIRTSDLKSLKHLLAECSSSDVEACLLARSNETLVVKRSSSGKELNVRNPTPLMMAVAGGSSDLILEYLADQQIGLSERCLVEDHSANPPLYRDMTPVVMAAITGKLKAMQTLAKHGALEIGHSTNNSAGDMALFEACFEGFLNLVQYLVEEGASVNFANARGISCLMISAYLNHIEIVKYLLSKGADTRQVDVQGRNALFYGIMKGGLPLVQALLKQDPRCVAVDSEGVTVLMEAATSGNMEIVKYLIEFDRKFGVNMSDCDNSGRNALFYCVENRHLDIFEFLLEEGVEIQKDSEGRTLLMAAALNGFSEIIEYFINNGNGFTLRLDETDNKGRNCLFYCITGGSVKLLEYLLKHGAPTNSSDSGISLLMQAAGKGKEDIVRFLLHRADLIEVNLNEVDKDGWNCLFYSVAAGQSSIMKIFLSRGVAVQRARWKNYSYAAVARGDYEIVHHLMSEADNLKLSLMDKDNDGWNSLFYCIQSENIEMVKILLNYGAKVSSSSCGSSLLMEASEKRKPRFVQYLLANRQDLDLSVNDRDDYGCNALFYAASSGCVRIVELLIQHSVKFENDYHDRSVLMQACLSGSIEVIQYLLKNNFVPDIQHVDDEGRSCLFYAVESGNVEVVQILLRHNCLPTSDHSGRNILMHAVVIGNQNILEYLIKHLSNVKSTMSHSDMMGDTVLSYAKKSGRKEIVMLLLQNGASCSSFNSASSGAASSTSPSTAASSSGKARQNTNVDRADELLIQHLVENDSQLYNSLVSSDFDFYRAVSKQDANGRTILFKCLNRRDFDLFSRLSKFYIQGSDSDSQGKTLLIRACEIRDIRFVEHLVVKMEVNVNCKDNSGRNALFYAVESGDFDIVKILVEGGIEIVQDGDKRNALMASVERGYLRINYFLMAYFSDKLLTQTDSNGQMMSHYAAAKGDLELIKTLYRKGISLTIQDNHGQTPLMLTCKFGRSTTLLALIRGGCDMEVKDIVNGYTALHHCCCSESPSLVCLSILLAKGANPNAEDNKKETALQKACRRKEITMVDCLLSHGAIANFNLEALSPGEDETPGKSRRGKNDPDPVMEDIKTLITNHSAMDKHLQEVIEDSMKMISENIETLQLVTFMKRADILDDITASHILDESSQQRQQTKILDALRASGNNNFYKFCDILRQSRFKALSYDLLSSSYVREDEVFV